MSCKHHAWSTSKSVTACTCSFSGSLPSRFPLMLLRYRARSEPYDTSSIGRDGLGECYDYYNTWLYFAWVGSSGIGEMGGTYEVAREGGREGSKEVLIHNV